jgi:hypothetical protein
MLRFFWLFLLALGFFWGGSANSATFQTETYSIKLPETWDSNPQRMGVTVLFYTIPAIGPQSCLMITVAKTSQGASSFVEATKQAVKKQFPEVSFLIERKAEQDRADWSELIYSHSGMQFLQLLAVRNGYAYNFTVTTVEERFRERLPEFRQIFSSWRFR